MLIISWGHVNYLKDSLTCVHNFKDLSRVKRLRKAGQGVETLNCLKAGEALLYRSEHLLGGVSHVEKAVFILVIPVNLCYCR